MNYLIRSAKDTSNSWITDCIQRNLGKETIALNLSNDNDIHTLRQILSQANRLKEPYDLILFTDEMDHVEYPAVTHALTQIFNQHRLEGVELHEETQVFVTCSNGYEATPMMDADLVRLAVLIDLDAAPGELDSMKDMLNEALGYESLADYQSNFLESRRLGVVAVQMASDDQIDGDDEGLEGIYEVTIDEPVPEFLAYELALEAFHCNQGVACLDDFQFHVVDLDSRKLLSNPYGFAMDNLGDHGCDKIESRIPRWAEKLLGLEPLDESGVEP
jgi:hypothetical protein